MSDFFDYRVKLTKLGPVRFVGHLDVMRYMQKAVRRAGLPIRYSEGYSPHQIMAFALPLSVGATSGGEYMDISLVSQVSPDEIVASLNRVMHEGITAIACMRLPEHYTGAMTVIAAASYDLTIREPVVMRLFGGEEKDLPLARTSCKIALGDFFAQEKILTIKKTKKGEQQIDLKPLIHRYEILEDGSARLLLHAGSKDHVKPSLLFGEFFKARGYEMTPADLMIHRSDLFTEEEYEGGTRYVPLIADTDDTAATGGQQTGRRETDGGIFR